MLDLSVIIVNYNTKEKLRVCLRSVLASKTRFQYEVWVVDNASADYSKEMVSAEFPSVKLLDAGANLGYSKANNLAIRQSSGRYVLLLNPDVEVMQDSFEKMLGFMEQNSRAGIAGCRVEKPDGSLDLACRRSFPYPLSALFRLSGLSFLFPKSKFSSYNLTYLPEDRVAEVDSVMGAFLLVSREVIGRIGLLDEDFFMYGEDLDWCFRAKAAGYGVFFAPVTKVIHYKGSSSKKVPALALREFHRAMVIFYDKHFAGDYPIVISWVVKTGIWLRYLLKSVSNALRREKYVSK